MIKSFKYGPGFTLLELILVIGILVTIAAVSRDFFGSFVSGAALRNEDTSITFNLRSARDNAMNGQNDMNWGVHFVNGAQDYYEIFSSPTVYGDASTTVATKVYLKNDIFFNTPGDSASADVVFNKITGTATATNIVLTSNSINKTISISGQGMIN